VPSRRIDVWAGQDHFLSICDLAQKRGWGRSDIRNIHDIRMQPMTKLIQEDRHPEIELKRTWNQSAKYHASSAIPIRTGRSRSCRVPKRSVEWGIFAVRLGFPWLLPLGMGRRMARCSSRKAFHRISWCWEMSTRLEWEILNVDHHWYVPRT
jgi:hypothetical protein